MNINTNEVLTALAAGLVVGIVLGFLAKSWPESGIGTV
jgi:xanthosine utilization system XapX-like protein